MLSLPHHLPGTPFYEPKYGRLDPKQTKMHDEHAQEFVGCIRPTDRALPTLLYQLLGGPICINL